MTDPTERALLRGIIANPHDDTPRLVYADWLDEHAETPRKCAAPDCVRGTVYKLGTAYDSAHERCPACRGTGTVSDGRAERAEFIRVQCELARLHDAGHGAGASKNCPVSVAYRADKRPGGQAFPKCRRCEDAFDAEHRECELLADRRREWARVPWVAGDAFGREPFATDPPNGSFHRGQATPHFRRGLVSRVEVPGLEWAFERVECSKCRHDGTLIGDPECVYCEGCGRIADDPDDEYTLIDCPHCDPIPCPDCSGAKSQWRVTPWALAVASTHPVTEFVMGDREPQAYHSVPYIVGWLSSEYFENGPSSACIPKCVYDRLPDTEHTGYHGAYQSREAALDALATAAADMVREAVLEAWAREDRAAHA